MKFRRFCALLLLLALLLTQLLPVTALAAEDIQIQARAALLVDGATGTVLLDQNAHTKQYPASITKVMTALLVFEAIDRGELRMDTPITASANSVAGLPDDASTADILAGETMTLEQLLYCLMIESANDAAPVIAEYVAGSEPAFVEMMNQKAAELGCTGTHFTNACGLFDENHYTTAKDLACIAAAAMRREDFRRIASAPHWQSAESERNFYNKNKTVRQYEGGDGVKIGFTRASGRTLVASATRGDVSLIAVVLRDGNWFADAYAMLDYGFAVTGAGRAAAEKGAQMPS